MNDFYYAPYTTKLIWVEKPKRPKGKWIENEYGDGDISYMCNQCKSEFALLDGTPLDNGYYFCPNCGSRNIEEGGEQDD